MVTNFRCWGITLLLSLLFLVTGGISAWGKEVRVGAGAAPTENVFNKVKEPMEKAIGLKLTLIDNGPYEALVELDQGKVDAAAGGLTFADWMSMMEKKGYQVPDRNAYKYRVIGKDLIKPRLCGSLGRCGPKMVFRPHYLVKIPKDFFF
jgi:hypothetical protein